MRSALICSISLYAFALLTSAGCGGGGSSLNTVPVSGTVTHNGKPVEGAAVTFSPTGEGHAAGGVTDAAGNYTLTTEVRGDGAVPGTYTVMISKFEQKQQPTTAEQDIDAAYAAAEAAGEDITGMGGTRAAAGPKNLLPEKYQSPHSSGLTATVSEGAPNTVNFDLE